MFPTHNEPQNPPSLTEDPQTSEGGHGRSLRPRSDPGAPPAQAQLAAGAAATGRRRAGARGYGNGRTYGRSLTNQHLGR